MEDTLNGAKAALVKSKDDMAKYYDHQPQNTNLETGCIWMPATSTPPGPLRNSLTGDLALSWLSGKLEMVHTIFVSLLL